MRRAIDIASNALSVIALSSMTILFVLEALA